MPKNNSFMRKLERKERVRVNETKRTYRECGHWHTDNGYSHCTSPEGGAHVQS